MGIILFDWEVPQASRKGLKPLLSMIPLFDGYLTGRVNYSPLHQKILFDW